jgi:hypothetical protein
MPLYHDEYDGPNDVEIGIEVVESSKPQLTQQERAAAVEIARHTGGTAFVMDVREVHEPLGWQDIEPAREEVEQWKAEKEASE